MVVAAAAEEVAKVVNNKMGIIKMEVTKTDMTYLEELFKKADRAMGKKLTTKDRKKLKKSVFCGPGRSFPCHDCAHIASAKAYLGRSKFSKATKKKIAACINRKAKQLGCKVTKKAKAHYDEEGKFEYNRFIELSAEGKKLYTSDVFKATKKVVDDSMKIKDLDLFTGIVDLFDNE